MTENIADDFYTKKHLRLTRIAFVARILAWIALALQIVWAVLNLAQTTQAYSGEGFSFIKMWNYRPAFAASLLAETIGIFFHGVVYWLVLKGASLGLYMIVETDLNYKERFQGRNDE